MCQSLVEELKPISATILDLLSLQETLLQFSVTALDRSRSKLAHLLLISGRFGNPNELKLPIIKT